MNKPLKLGELPIDVINRALGLELEEGEVYLSVKAKEHIRQDHPEAYDIIISNIGDIIANPSYIGQSPKHRENFEVVKRVDGAGVLVAIGIEQDKNGYYRIRSAYMVSEEKINNRRMNGTLKSAIKR